MLLPQAPFEVVEVLAHLRTDVGVGRHGRGALVFAVLPRQLMGSADKELRIGFVQDRAHADLMLGRAVGMEKQHCDRFEAFFLYNARNRARLLLVKRRTHRAVSKHPLGDLEDVLPRHQGPVLTEARVERFRAIDPADLVNVPEPFSGNKSRLGALALNDGVHHDGRAVDQGQNLIERHDRLGQTLLNASRQLRRRRERLRQRQRTFLFVENNNVCERAPDVNGYSQSLTPYFFPRPTPQVQNVPAVQIVQAVRRFGLSILTRLAF